MRYRIGDIVEGTVTGIQPYGAFVQLDQTTQGLVHISECRSAYIKQVQDELKVGQKIQVMILDIDEYDQKISLSQRSIQDLQDIKDADFTEKHTFESTYHVYWTNQHLNIGFETISKHLNQFLQEALVKLRQ
ncbi:CvfD/Ygs/GSP13 family RNA-binding post-transcriptional regulator [Weissella viridescens]|uniref:CvfD/Ygs/GSP13 family RNA-binding post-transcriptional regulator n=1 Tax=Weissella viridescens TaxID=1629 RepID=UPI002578B986|nr:CvfD/Ygs/GSP13 family RNA-binding post-transcriptional regulator [Weissella viridescens]WJI91899.1 CvfD/Ygs/GSP13 family RNA-binding post-transcriptional regulator [Weissella viridescens]